VGTIILSSMGCGLARAQSLTELTVASWEKAEAKASAAASAPAKTGARELHVTEASRPGLYAVTSSENLEPIEGRVTSFERSGSRLASALTLGIHATARTRRFPVPMPRSVLATDRRSTTVRRTTKAGLT